MARVEQQSQKVADRWAPDGAAAEKQPASLRALGFADRMIVSYLGGGSRESAPPVAAGAPARGDEGRARPESGKADDGLEARNEGLSEGPARSRLAHGDGGLGGARPR